MTYTHNNKYIYGRNQTLNPAAHTSTGLKRAEDSLPGFPDAPHDQAYP